MAKDIVLAFSGGLDTSFCVPYLIDKGYQVTTLFVDTGGVDEAERQYIHDRAMALGAKRHVTAQGGQDIWDEVVVPLVMGGQLYQNQYPLLCSDRYIIVRRSLELCREIGTDEFAHGCTGMGNDQVRFDQTVRSLGDFKIVAPIREIQQEHPTVRVYEQEYLTERGFEVRGKTSQYSINTNLLGVTSSGSEIDEFQAPGDETWTLCAHPNQWPRQAMRASITFEKGQAVALNGEAIEGPAMIAALNQMFGAYGVGRGIYTGDTVVGLKGRIVFECPGMTALLTAHRALENTVLSQFQNQYKAQVAQKWVELVYRGFFYEPLKRDLEAFIRSSQEFVTGTVTLETWGGAVLPVAVDSEHILQRAGAVYAQTSDWTVTEAEGFIKLLGQSSSLSAQVNPLYKL